MKRLLILTVAVLGLGAVPVAAAGGWATAGVAAPPDNIRAGDTWNAQVTILQHGETPLAGVKPTLTITNGAGKSVKFDARPTGKPGVYQADVEFPTAGTWRYEIYDGFTEYGGAQTHTFGPLVVDPGSGGSGFPLWLLLLGIAAALVAVTVAVTPRLVRPRMPAAARR